MSILRKHKFYAKLKKCNFFQRSITFLGHDIDEKGMHINANKVKAIRSWGQLTSRTEVQPFVGFA